MCCPKPKSLQEYAMGECCQFPAARFRGESSLLKLALSTVDWPICKSMAISSVAGASAMDKELFTTQSDCVVVELARWKL